MSHSNDSNLYTFPPNHVLNIEQSRTPSERNNRFQRISEGEDESNRVTYIRERYIRHLGYGPLNTHGYLPNLLPFLRQPMFELDDANQSSAARVNEYDDMMEDEGVGGRSGRGPLLQAGSLKSSIFNLITATLGAGVLAIPYAFANGGIIMGSIMLILFGFCSMTSCNYLVQVIEHRNLTTYESMALEGVNTAFAVLTDVMIIMFCFGTALAYLISIGDIVQLILDELTIDYTIVWHQYILSRPFCSLVVVLFILLPLCLVEKLGDLRFTSVFGFIAMCGLVLSVLCLLIKQFIEGPKLDIRDYLYPPSATSSIRSATVIVFAFSCHPNVPKIYSELENKNFRRMKKVTIRSISMCFTIYFIMGLAGYLSFGADTNQNVLVSLFDKIQSKAILIILYGGVFTAITFAYPMNIFPCSFSLEMLVFWFLPTLSSSYLRIIITVTIVMLTYILSMVLPGISVVFQLVGSINGSFVSFIIPAVLLIKLIPGPLTHKRKLKALFLASLGGVIAIVGTTQAVIDAFNL